MTEETRKLFDAPWKAVEDKDSAFAFMHHVDVCTKNGDGHVIAYDCIGDDGNRLARLPELYDALEEMMNDYCKSCMYIRPRGTLDCKYCESWCLARKHLELLRKVRDGE